MPVKTEPRLLSEWAMAAFMHRYLDEGIAIAACIYSLVFCSGGNLRSGFPGSGDGGVSTSFTLLRASFLEQMI